MHPPHAYGLMGTDVIDAETSQVLWKTITMMPMLYMCVYEDQHTHIEEKNKNNTKNHN